MPVEDGPCRRTSVLVLALAALGAGVIHLVHAPAHTTEWLPLGLGFYAAGLLQIAWAAALVLHPSRAVLRLGAIGSAGFAGFWLLTRTTGMPLGPEAFRPEAVGRADALCTALELLVVLAPVLWRVRRRAVVAVTAGLVLSATGVALAAPVHQHHHVCDSAPQLTGVLDARGVDTGVTAYFRCRLEHEHHH